jgi:hypothetical protein
MPEGRTEVPEIDTESQEFQDALAAAVETKLQEEAAELKKALQVERKARRDAEKAAGRFSDDDLEELAAYREAKDKAEQDAAVEAKDWERLKANLMEVHARDLDARDKEIGVRDERLAAMQRSLDSALIESAATRAIGEHKGNAKLLLPIVNAATKIIEHDGGHRAVVLGSDGEPRLGPDHKTATDYMTVSQLVAEMKESGEYAGAFPGTGASGGGSSASQGSGGSGSRVIDGNDPWAIGRNAEAIAAGKAKVAL